MKIKAATTTETHRDIAIRRIKMRRGLYIVKRGGVWYAEMCNHGFKTRRSL